MQKSLENNLLECGGKRGLKVQERMLTLANEHDYHFKVSQKDTRAEDRSYSG